MGRSTGNVPEEEPQESGSPANHRFMPQAAENGGLPVCLFSGGTSQRYCFM